jgi:hypothetical protein
MILSEADPDKFRTYFQPVMAKLENKGIQFSGIELGNELNWSNHDLGPIGSGSGRILTSNDLLHDPKGRQVAKGYLQYIKVLSVMKDIRDHSRLNRHTPIISGTSSAVEPSGPLKSLGTTARDAVSFSATLQFLRANGMDEIVDAYAVHWYPEGSVSPAVRLSSLKQALAECRSDKPCWMTEWGLPASSGIHCPAIDVKRTAIFSELRDDFKTFVRQGRLKVIIFYTWEGDVHMDHEDPYSAFLCGSLTKSGRLAIAPF